MPHTRLGHLYKVSSLLTWDLQVEGASRKQSIKHKILHPIVSIFYMRIHEMLIFRHVYKVCNPIVLWLFERWRTNLEVSITLVRKDSQTRSSCWNDWDWDANSKNAKVCKISIWGSGSDHCKAVNKSSYQRRWISPHSFTQKADLYVFRVLICRKSIVYSSTKTIVQLLRLTESDQLDRAVTCDARREEYQTNQRPILSFDKFHVTIDPVNMTEK